MPARCPALDPNRRFSISEVAAITDVAPKTINRFIDDLVLPANAFRKKDRERSIYAFACPIVRFYSSEAGSSLTQATRKEIANSVMEVLKSDWDDLFRWRTSINDHEDALVEYDRILNKDFEKYFASKASCFIFTKGEMELKLNQTVETSLVSLLKLWLAESRIVEDPDIRGGIPTIKGTRISPYEAAGMARADGIDSAMETYPSLSRDDFEMATLYAKAKPLRGRPKKEDDWRKGWRLVSETTVPLSQYAD